MLHSSRIVQLPRSSRVWGHFAALICCSLLFSACPVGTSDTGGITDDFDRSTDAPAPGDTDTEVDSAATSDSDDDDATNGGGNTAGGGNDDDASSGEDTADVGNDDDFADDDDDDVLDDDDATAGDDDDDATGDDDDATGDDDDDNDTGPDLSDRETRCYIACETSADCCREGAPCPNPRNIEECIEGACVATGCADDQGCKDGAPQPDKTACRSVRGAAPSCVRTCEIDDDCCIEGPPCNPLLPKRVCNEGVCEAAGCELGETGDTACTDQYRRTDPDAIGKCVSQPDGPNVCVQSCTKAADCCPPGSDCAAYPLRFYCLESVCRLGGCIDDDECKLSIVAQETGKDAICLDPETLMSPMTPSP